MKSFQYEIKDELGLHARPAGMLVKEAKKFVSVIKLSKDDKTVVASQLLMLMSMGVKKGDVVTLTMEGNDENEAYNAIETFFRDNL